LDGLTAEALRHLEKALTHDPNHAPALIALSNAYLDQGSFPEVEKLLKKALSLRQDKSEVFYLMARLLALQDDHAGAAEAIDEAIKLEGNQSKYYKLASEIARVRQKSFEHQFFLESLIDLEPLDGKAHYELGKLLNHPDEFDRIKLLFEISIDLLPGDSQPLYSLAQHLYAGEKSLPDGTVSIQSEPEYAKKLLRELLSISPSESKAKILLAEIELKGDAENVATRLLEEALKDEKTKGEASYKLGLIWEKKGNKDKSTRYYKSAMKHVEWQALGEFRLAVVIQGKGHVKDAEIHFKKCLSSFKKKEGYLMKSKDLHLEKSDFHTSRKELESLQLIRKCLGEANLAIYKCNYESRNDESISRYLDEALLHYPHYPEANYEKGLYYLESGEEENAKVRFEKCAESDWSHWPSHMELAKIAKIGNECQKAEMHLKIVLDLDLGNKAASAFLKKIQKFSKK
jgi:Tfp pilus assembly protein PilF